MGPRCGLFAFFAHYTAMGKALFLDRDGVVNRETGYVWQLEHFHLQPAVFTLAQAARSAGYDLVVITNQGGIAKGLYGHEQVSVLHAYMEAQFRANGIAPPFVLYCPHHPDSGHCLCRKPESLLFERARALFDADPAESYMIGDRERDLVPAKKIGLHTIMVGNHQSTYADLHFADMQQTTHYFLQHVFAAAR
jgi:D-glycero-D-manno-heptose 1,7-bisphosphate phosphatase